MSGFVVMQQHSEKDQRIHTAHGRDRPRVIIQEELPEETAAADRCNRDLPLTALQFRTVTITIRHYIQT